MSLANCYRLLGLRYGAELKDVKASYRRLARKYHPDANPNNRDAQAHFIRVTEAYKLLIDVLEQDGNGLNDLASDRTGAKTISVTEEPASEQSLAELSQYEQKLKWNSYETLHQLLQEGKFVRAIALIEGLAQRLPQDLEVRQWQAIAYYQQGRSLIKQKQLTKAKIYLRKAISADPHNRPLGEKIQHDLERIERLM